MLHAEEFAAFEPPHRFQRHGGADRQFAGIDLQGAANAGWPLDRCCARMGSEEGREGDNVDEGGERSHGPVCMLWLFDCLSIGHKCRSRRYRRNSSALAKWDRLQRLDTAAAISRPGVLTVERVDHGWLRIEAGKDMLFAGASCISHAESVLTSGGFRRRAFHDRAGNRGRRDPLPGFRL
ncbi:hypothetical protein NGR_c04640 [Sinorhizobium fredii NGR234]|uniref:Uncharacterized protein n=1 Tax=Sinorhizobium fredii (strain NBRC 101917 / NGR234) TaxID=394 RepID=C3MHD2_SINFN|nr:hypothetical protein NGR_c04640 [Sinorhizobium fredii NGR234]